MSGKSRIGRYFQDHKGKVVTIDQVREASGIQSAPRRIRELREEGWPIDTHNDDASLRPGEYRLTDKPPPREQRKKPRRISKNVRAQVLDRDGFTCQMCGSGAGDDDPLDPRRSVRLHVDHIWDRAHDGPDTLDNYRTLCSHCNEGARDSLPEPPSWSWLLGQVRRASIDVQRQLLAWLRNRLGE